MQSSPLQLEDYYLKKLEFSLLNDLAEKPVKGETYEPVEFSVSYDSKPIEANKRRWRCELTVEFLEKAQEKVPYNFQVTLVGFFGISEKWPEERIDDLAKVNCPAVLYSAIREILVTITGRNLFPTLVLPSVTFIGEAFDKKTEKEKPVKKSKSAPKTAKPALKRKGETIKKK
ncbi:MAG TPA: protein-export chaperone SecB [Pedobacter sp.]|jgi:preprotein translocase subunit SecB